MLLDTIALDSITIKQVSKTVGVGAFSRFPSHSGQVIYKDLPLVSIQHTANRRFIRACQHCHSPIGSVKEQFELIFNEHRFNQLDLTGLPVFDSSIYSCACGESYCSTSCASEAYKRHHYCLCVNASGEHSSAVSEFKFYCLSIDGCGDNLLLLAQLLATVASISEGQFPKFQEMISELLTFTNRPFDDVARPPCGFERDAEWQAWLESTISEAFELLFRALSGQSTVFAQFFSHKQEAFNTLSRLLSVFELNNIDISIPSSLGERVRNLCRQGFVIEPILREKEVVMRALWNDEAKGVYEDSDFGDEILEESEGIEIDECHSDGTGCVDDLLERIRVDVNLMTFDELLDSEYPNFHGTGLYISVARTNHSCKPNVSMDFNEGNAAVSCTAIRDIQEDEELQMSYISNPAGKSVSHRQSQLADYLFLCNCELCSKNIS